MHFSQFNLILEHWGDRKRGNGHQVVGIVSQADWSLINKTDQNKHASKDVDKGLFPKAKSYLASACQARKSVAGSNLSGPTWDKTKFNFLFLINSTISHFVQPEPLFASYWRRWQSFYVCQAAVEEEAAWKYYSLWQINSLSKKWMWNFQVKKVKKFQPRHCCSRRQQVLCTDQTGPRPREIRVDSWTLSPSLSPFSVLMHVSADFFTWAIGQCSSWMGGMGLKEVTFDTYLTIAILHGYQILYKEINTKTN